MVGIILQIKKGCVGSFELSTRPFLEFRFTLIRH